jgi:IclR family pca regulon transcriptional regulator
VSEQKLAREYVGALVRGLAVIRAFGADAERLTITEVADRTKLTRAGARRILLTLRHLGYVTMEGRWFSLTPLVLELGFSYFASKPLWGLAGPVLRELARVTGETASASALDGHDIVYILRVPSERVLHLDLKAGHRLPAYATSSGRVMLASLKPNQLNSYFRGAQLRRLTRHTIVDERALRAAIREAGKKGWSCVRGEIEETVVGLAAPVRDGSGRTVAALNVSTNQDRAPDQVVQDVLLPSLQAAARQLEQSLGLFVGLRKGVVA